MIDPHRIWTSSQLPTLPSVAVRLLDLSRDPDADLKQVTEATRQDPAIVAKILKAINSAYFGVSSEVTSIGRAIPLLGKNVVTSLALSFSLSESAMTSGPFAKYFKDYWVQSVVQAAVCQMLSDGDDESEYFLTGLLMDIGQLAMLKTVGADYSAALEFADRQQRELAEVESEVLGINHVEVGVNLMQNWKLPERIVEATRYQHASLDRIHQARTHRDFERLTAVAVSAAVGDYLCASGKGHALKRLRDLTAAFYNFEDTELFQFLDRARSRVDEAGESFAADTSKIGTPTELMAQANEQLAELTLRQQIVSAEIVARQKRMEAEKRELESLNRKLQQRVIHDPLTQLHNRRFFDETIAREFESCRRTASPIAVLFADVDRFKSLNDTYGHAFGDVVLQDIGKIFDEQSRTCDVAARYGGEEFVILAPRTTEKGVARLAERIRNRVETAEIYHGGRRIPVTVSIGTAVMVPRRNQSDMPAHLISAADEAMYDAKHEGRNRVCSRMLLSDAERDFLSRVSGRRFSRWLVAHGLFDVPTISRVLLRVTGETARLGELALREGFVSSEDIERILQEQQATNERFGQLAKRLSVLNDDQLAHLLALQQESPESLAGLLVERGLFTQQEAFATLETYRADTSPTLEVPASTGETSDH